MKTCEFLTIDDCPCNDLAVEKFGKKWYCLEHVLRLKFDGNMCCSVDDEDEDDVLELEEEYYYDQQRLLS